MKTPEEIRKGLLCEGPCSECPYIGRTDKGCGVEAINDTLDYIQQLEEENERLHEQVCLMLIQMRGDCGTCKHKADWSKCSECARKEDSPLWEYEGLPEVNGHAEDPV